VNSVVEIFIRSARSRPIHRQDTWDAVEFFNEAADEAYRKIPPLAAAKLWS